MDERPLAAVTMLRDDYDFLQKWLTHYERLTGRREALYVIAHGPNPRIEEMAKGASVLTIPHFDNGSQFEPRRRRLFFGLVQGLLAYYQFVVTTDVDEFIVLDPDAGTDLAGYLRATDFQGAALSPAGFDVVHKPSEEPGAFTFDRPVTEQRRHGYLEGAYCKPCIFRTAPLAGGNAHFLNGEPWEVDPNIVLFHLKHFDRTFGLAMAEKRKDTVLGYEKKARTHRIGGWHNRDLKLGTTIARIERCRACNRPPPDSHAAAAPS
ncbi:MAG: glycosyltransferase family 2 protein, partial [Pseudomonadota bacterium]